MDKNLEQKFINRLNEMREAGRQKNQNTIRFNTAEFVQPICTTPTGETDELLLKSLQYISGRWLKNYITIKEIGYVINPKNRSYFIVETQLR